MESWVTLPFGNCIKDVSAGNSKVSRSGYRKSGVFPVIDQGKEFIAGYVDNPALCYRGELPVIVFGDHTRVFKYVDFPFCAGAEGIKILRPKGGLHPRYLYHVLSSLKIPSAGYSRHFKFLKEFDVPVPSGAEQRRIARILDGLTVVIAKRCEAIALLDRLAQSIFMDMFGDPVSNQREWGQRQLGELGRVVTGNTPPRADADNFGSEIEWIKSDNISSESIYLTQASERLSQKGARKARLTGPGSLLVTCIAGSPSSIGNVSIADREVAFNQQINSFSPQGGNPLFYYFLLRLAKPLVLEKSTGGMKGLVSKSRFESVSLIDPPCELKQCFSRVAESFVTLRSSQSAHLVRLNQLFASVQHRAFRGEL